MVKFKSLEYKNIQSVGNHPIKIQLDRNPTTLIGGQNGSGKSTLLTAMFYNLFGAVLSGNKLSDIINTINKNKLLTTVTFEKNGEEWKIVRGEKPKIFEIYKNGELLDQMANARDQQEFLNTVLGMDAKLFTQIVLLNRERYVPFMECTTAERRKIIEDVLVISVISQMNEVNKNLIKSLEREESTIENNRRIIQTKIQGQERLIQQIKDQIESEKSSNDAEIAELSARMAELEAERESLKAQYDEIDTAELASIKKTLQELRTIYSDISSKAKLDEKHLTFFTDNEQCPTCDQSITTETKTAKIELYGGSVKEFNEAKAEMTAMIEGLSAQQSALEALEDKKRSIKSKLNNVEYSINSIDKDIVKLQSKPVSSNLNEKLEEAEAELIALNKSAADMVDTAKELSSELEYYNTIRDMLKDDGVKAYIIRDYINIINRKMNEFLNAMNFFVNMRLDENFNESFHAINKEGFTYKSLSTGQKTRVNLAIWLALLEVAAIKNSVVSNVLFLDEILENLDSNGVKDFMDLCNSKLSHSNVFVISQRYDEFKDYFRSSIQFKLNNDFTEIVL